MTDLARIEAALDRPEVSSALCALEARLPTGVRPRQCSARTLVVGMLTCLTDGHQSAHLTAVHAALFRLDERDQVRLGVLASWRRGPHALTYRQIEYTAGLLVRALGKDCPDGAPSKDLQQLCDALVEASIPERFRDASSSYAIDWTDVASFSCPPSEPDGPCADPEASWGHRRGDGPGQRDELFFGYYASAMTMVTDEHGHSVPELVRRVQVSSCRHDPVPAFVAVVTNAAASGVVVHDLLADSGYAYKVPEHFAVPLRRSGVSLVIDLHPNDRGPRGTFAGAICHNGNLYCPATSKALFELGPLSRGASQAEVAAHDEKAAELSRYKLGRIAADDADGYHRVACPAVMGKVRCPLRPASMALSHERPSVLTPPEHPPTCCTQKSLTVPPAVNAKTAQRHDYPSGAHRRSYARRSAVERANSRLKDPAGIDIDVRGWCKLMGVTPLGLFLACACVVVNFGLIDAFEAHQAEKARQSEPRVARPRRRRRRTLADLAGANAPP
ncbi:MAG TPA: hypothetical protein VMU75_03155 [Acidimicrobiales bacterium]|nr:hypothetical protein [Acidimicrobiales bacterium]